MYPFHNQISVVPYTFLAAAAVGINVIRKSYTTGETAPLSNADLASESLNYRDKYSIPSEEQERFNNLKKFIEESTKFVYLNKTFSVRVSVQAKDGDWVKIAGGYYKIAGNTSKVEKFNGTGTVYPALEVFDTESQGALVAGI